MTAESPTADPEIIYQIKVQVMGSRPPIWRRLQTPDISLARLHLYVQALMGWSDAFYHAFHIRGRYYVDADQYKSTTPISPALRFSPRLSGAVRRWLASLPLVSQPPLDEAGITLSSLALGEGEGFLYEYGWWRLQVVFQRPRRPRPGASYPLCVQGRRASPPEQLSGMRGVKSVDDALTRNEHERGEGYRVFLAAIQDRRHPRHEALRAWVGGKFDPEAFSLRAVNRELKRLK